MVGVMFESVPAFICVCLYKHDLIKLVFALLLNVESDLI